MKAPWHVQVRRAPKEQRTFDGVVYPSKAEAQRAAELKTLGQMGYQWSRQPRFELGVPENVYVADFLVTAPDGHQWAEDVKGWSTPKFNRDKRLWRSYGPMPLRILKRSGNGWKIELIEARNERECMTKKKTAEKERKQKAAPKPKAVPSVSSNGEHDLIQELRRAELRLREADVKVGEIKGDLKAARDEQGAALKALRDLAGDNADGQSRMTFDAAAGNDETGEQ